MYAPAQAAFILALLTASLLVSRLGTYVFPATTTEKIARSLSMER
jgi:hypothetical protein